MTRFTLTMADTMAQRLDAAARTTGFTPENLALAGVALAVASIEKGDGLPLAVGITEAARPTGWTLPPAADEEL